ncbi:uncharacterized protein FFB20_09477 [Fusarium fujikuroi]|nr:uncharacterized protein FFC1_03117 [Fusarium fujikuroi]SCN85090.1 uncharacterized protein FFE2_05592 [Fusarium fujikuroi]SCN91451.1 uncharacterized protein FFM5_05039 [Fusarium fujikuroi]SCN93569.1 uncharacterized protein FFB20_09477 [Fusarium fujikuroi]SCO31913.1 uncharacterized protein FFNC_02573 [Fusarium fujikuroi]
MRSDLDNETFKYAENGFKSPISVEKNSELDWRLRSAGFDDSYTKWADKEGVLLTVTRSHKANDRDHKGIAEGTALPTENVPRFFGKNGFADVDPKKVKKDGSGRGNWGTVNDDIADEQFTFTNTRRRSNSSSFSHHVSDLKTKFEVNEPEPVFEESLHGPEEEDHEDLSKTDSSESGRSSS